jgi:four helix bundle protein
MESRISRNFCNGERCEAILRLVSGLRRRNPADEWQDWRLVEEEMNTRKYDLQDRLLEFSLQIIRIVEQLPNTRTGNHVAGQLLRAGTSPHPNHAEAQAAESPKDFVHKLRIALKELRETQRWLRLIQHARLIDPSEQLNRVLQENDELIRIFVASIRTAEKNKAGS